jgi:hypothetical protein
MDTPRPVILRLLLLICFAASSAFANGASLDDTQSVWIEICANGTTKTISIDSNDVAAEPGHIDHDCQRCCDGNCVEPLTALSPIETLSEIEPQVFLVRAGVPDFQDGHGRPMPRGPPLGKNFSADLNRITTAINTRTKNLNSSVRLPFHIGADL